MSRCPHCGAHDSRSTPQLRRYFAVIKAAFHHWPERHRFHPRDSAHLRKWLQCAAGHFTLHTIDLPAGTRSGAIVNITRGVMEAAGSYAFISAEDEVLNIVIPKSIDYRRLSHRDACRLFQEVEDVIKVELGVEAEQLLKQTEQAA